MFSVLSSVTFFFSSYEYSEKIFIFLFSFFFVLFVFVLFVFSYFYFLFLDFLFLIFSLFNFSLYIQLKCPNVHKPFEEDM